MTSNQSLLDNDSDEESSSSQTLSSLPSPRILTLESRLTSSQTSSVPSFCSQPSSLPSTRMMSLDKLINSGVTPCPCTCDVSQLLSKLEEFSLEDKIQVLSALILRSDKSSLLAMNDENVNHLSKIFGEYCRDKIKSEADIFRFKRSREDCDLSSVDILSKKLKIEPLHIFYESATGKSGRSYNKFQEKVAPHHATFYESLLKGANLNTLGPFNLSKVNKLKLKVQSKLVFENHAGGVYTFHQNVKPTTPLPMTYIGPLISDNAQRGCGKFQHHSYGKLDRSTPIFVTTHNIRAESVNDNNDNEIFEDESVAPFNHQFHPLFRPVSPSFHRVVEERVKRDATNGQLAVNTVFQKWIDEIKEDKNTGQGVTSFEKIADRLNFGPAMRSIICQKCHEETEYDVKTQNVCPRCNNNPTYFTESELGPYREYKFPENGPNTVKVKEQEPIPVNPSGRKNLTTLHEELKKFWPPNCKSFPFYGDGLPAVSYERIKSDSVQCLKHGVNIPLKGEFSKIKFS